MKLKTIILIILSLKLSLTCTGQHIILITIDGFRPTFYQDNIWQCHNMSALAKMGYAAPYLKGIFPTVTYPSHTSIVTGELSGNHGIFYNVPLELEKSTGNWNWYTDSIKCSTIWKEAKNAGLKTAAVLWPVTVGAGIDFNIPEIWSTDKSHDRLQPMKQHCFPAGLWEEIEASATGKLSSADLDGENLLFDTRIAQVASYLFMSKKPNLLLVHFPCVDEVQHTYGTNHPEVFKAVKNVDSCIGIILQAVNKTGLKEKTTIIVTGDHGFTNIQKGFYPNVLLQDTGLIEQKDGLNMWKAKFQATGGSAFLYTKEKQTVSRVKKMLENQPDSIRSLYDILEKQTLNKFGIDSNVSLAIAMKEGVFVGNNVTGNVVGKAPQKGAHGFLPTLPSMQTGFIISRCMEQKPETLLDIMPILRKILFLQSKI